MQVIHMNYDKPFKTFDAMAIYLESGHGLTITGGDAERQYISDILHVVPYYDLVNGYKDVFMKDDRFHPGTRFSDLVLFYSFDRGFQNAIFPFSNVVEDYFKNILAYIMARDFGVCRKEYLDRRNYVTSSGKISYAETYENIRRVYEKQKKDESGKTIYPIEYIPKSFHEIEEPTCHYVKIHNHVPPWILLKNVTFSNASNLFCLMKSKQKEEIADMMISADIPVDQKIQILIYSLTLIRKFRNHMAHNLKFISFDTSKYARGLNRASLSKWIPRELVSKNELKRGIGISDIYAYILFSVALIPNSPYKSLLIARLSSYLGYFSSTPQALLWEAQYVRYAQATHLPLNLRDRLSSYLADMANKLS